MLHAMPISLTDSLPFSNVMIPCSSLRVRRQMPLIYKGAGKITVDGNFKIKGFKLLGWEMSVMN
jgi:hypothetical protein